jgi:hypothetical protein
LAPGRKERIKRVKILPDGVEVVRAVPNKHKNANQSAELIDELETLFFRYAAQFPILTVIFASFKMEIRKSETKSSVCTIPILAKV